MSVQRTSCSSVLRLRRATVRTFQAFIPDLHELATWLKRCGIETVALESTGILPHQFYEVLEQYRF
jgi:transposase